MDTSPESWPRTDGKDPASAITASGRAAKREEGIIVGSMLTRLKSCGRLGSATDGGNGEKRREGASQEGRRPLHVLQKTRTRSFRHADVSYVEAAPKKPAVIR